MQQRNPGDEAARLQHTTQTSSSPFRACNSSKDSRLGEARLLAISRLPSSKGTQRPQNMERQWSLQRAMHSSLATPPSIPCSCHPWLFLVAPWSAGSLSCSSNSSSSSWVPVWMLCAWPSWRGPSTPWTSRHSQPGWMRTHPMPSFSYHPWTPWPLLTPCTTCPTSGSACALHSSQLLLSACTSSLSSQVLLLQLMLLSLRVLLLSCQTQRPWSLPWWHWHGLDTVRAMTGSKLWCTQVESSCTCSVAGGWQTCWLRWLPGSTHRPLNGCTALRLAPCRSCLPAPLSSCQGCAGRWRCWVISRPHLGCMSCLCTYERV
mmetsp:Transcript_2551/g.6485  ORF Transcript_2551/g.6485 Transcript_2551/m.6485 type:complete len:318 (+) Transcript_2551:2392-3345(+)